MVLRYRTWKAADLDRLVGQVLQVLPEPDDEPASTPEVRRRFPQLDAYERENYVLRALNILAAGNWATKFSVPGDMRVFWRLTPAGLEGGRNRGHELPPAH